MTDTEEKQKKAELTPANENPWYLLMTLHGEQAEDANPWKYDVELHLKNRRDWNKWASRALSYNQRQALLDVKDNKGNPLFEQHELTPHTPDEWAKLAADFAVRGIGNGILELPDPATRNDFSFTGFGSFFASGLIFAKDTDLRNATFSGNAYLRGATFLGDAYLRDAKFLSNVFFSGTTFLGYADLRGAAFSGHADLRGVTFSGYADFADTIFSSSAFLSGTTFLGSADLRGAAFSGHADLRGATFSVYAFLKDATFLGDAGLSGATFSGDAELSSATFSGNVDFSNVDFKRSISFERAKFLTSPPNFHEAKLHSDTNWLDAEWPAPPKGREAAATHVRYYQRLKQVMETLKKHEDELDFFAREMAAQRVVDGGWTSLRGFLNGLYALTSDYGRSVARPLAMLYPLIVLPGLLFDGFRADSKADLEPYQALGLSISNTFGVFTFAKATDAVSHLLPWAKSLAFVQAVLGATLLFLAGLALRNRFRMK